MIGIVVITHGNLATGLKSAATLLNGNPEHLSCAELHLGDNPLEFKESVEQAIAEVDDGDGILVLADIFGGTPSNTVSQLFAHEGIRAIAGVNLPMVIQAICLRDQVSLEELTEQVKQAGCESHIDIRQKFIEAAAADDDDDF